MSTRIDIRSQARWLAPIATLLVASSCVDTDSTFPLQPSSRVSHAIGYCPPGAACYPLADFMSNTVYMDIQNVNGEASEDCRLVKDALLDAYWGGRMAYFDELVVPNEWGSYSASQFQITLSTRITGPTRWRT